MGNKGEEQSAVQKIEEEEIKKLFMGIMGGYDDNVIPPLSYFSPIPQNEKGSSSRKRHQTETSLPQSLLKERKRREQMSEKFSVLQSMVPSLFDAYKPSKDKIIGDTVDYIKYLQEETERLEALMKFQRKEQNDEKPVILKCTNRNSSVKIASNDAAFLAVQLPYKRGSVLEIVKVLEKHEAEVFEARVCVNDQRLLTFTATVKRGSNGGSIIDKIREELLTL